MIIDKDTKLYFSVSSKPGNFGATLYNAAFEKLGINAIYKPLYCDKSNFPNFFRGVSGFAAGLSISMPFKKDAFYLCDIFGDIAKDIGNVNTVIFSNAFLKGFGYNTDYHGFMNSCKSGLLKNGIKNVLIFGNGSVARTIKIALNALEISHTVVTKDDDYYLVNKGKKYDALINATPVGMDGFPDNVFEEHMVKNYKFIFDVVVKKETNLINLAKKLDIPHVNGVSMSLEQLCEQFQLYQPGREAPRDLFEKTLKEHKYI